MSDYFSHPYVSNSNLSALYTELTPRDQCNMADAMAMGTLIHALLLEPHRVDHIRWLVVGQPYQYTIAQFQHARKLRDYALTSPLVQGMVKLCDKETELYADDVPFSYQGIDFELPCRCKYDLLQLTAALGGDIKTTTATSQAGFVQEIERFQYHRARVFYSRISGVQQDVLIGINKRLKGVFPVFLKQGTELWNKGEALMNELAYRYWAIKHEQQ